MIIKVSVKSLLLLQLPIQSYELGDWFYEQIHYIFCRDVDPLQLTEYLVKQNCLTVTDLVGSTNNKTIRYEIFIVDFWVFFSILMYFYTNMTNLISRIILQIYSMTD